MVNPVLTSVKKAVKNWWVSLLVGILAVVTGIWCFVTPDRSLAAMTFVFVVIFLVGGILEIGFALSNRKILHDWGCSLYSLSGLL